MNKLIFLGILMMGFVAVNCAVPATGGPATGPVKEKRFNGDIYETLQARAERLKRLLKGPCSKKLNYLALDLSNKHLGLRIMELKLKVKKNPILTYVESVLSDFQHKKCK
jgi:hypothetical protein